MRKMALALAVMFCTASIGAVPAAALSPEQRRLFDSGIDYHDLNVGDGSSWQACLLPGGNNAEKVWNFFVGKGYSGEQAAGILGNMEAESGIEPMRAQGRPASEQISSEQVASGNWPGGPAWGIVQWDPPTKMIDPSVDADMSYEEIDTVEYQVQFLWEQLEGEGIGNAAREKSAGDHLKQQTSVDGAARSFMTKYERPRDQSESKQRERSALAAKWYLEFSSNTTGASGCANSSSEFSWPDGDKKGSISSCYGVRTGIAGASDGLHPAIDIGNPVGGGDDVTAAAAGIVTRTTNSYGIVTIDHENGYVTEYWHNSSFNVRTGDRVNQGDVIAKVGGVGRNGANSFSPHIHFEIHNNGTPENPLDHLPKEGRTIQSNANNTRNCPPGDTF